MKIEKVQKGSAKEIAYSQAEPGKVYRAATKTFANARLFLSSTNGCLIALDDGQAFNAGHFGDLVEVQVEMYASGDA